MADTSLFSRLRRLFSTNVIVRNVGGRQLRVSDTSRTQAIAKSNLVDRYQKIYMGAGLSGYSDSMLTKSMRLNLFKDYEQMDSDAIVASATLTYETDLLGGLTPFGTVNWVDNDFDTENFDFASYQADGEWSWLVGLRYNF